MFCMSPRARVRRDRLEHCDGLVAASLEACLLEYLLYGGLEKLWLQHFIRLASIGPHRSRTPHARLASQTLPLRGRLRPLLHFLKGPVVLSWPPRDPLAAAIQCAPDICVLDLFQHF